MSRALQDSWATLPWRWLIHANRIDRRTLRRRLCFGGILVLAALLRFSHLDIAHFQLDQALSAQSAWDMAREGEFSAHGIRLTGGYSNFPLATYIWTPAFVASTDVRALLIWNTSFSLAALALLWAFVARYWSWQAAAIATLLFATAPWQVWFAHRIWCNSLMPPFVMLWLFGTVFACQERRLRFWALCWGMAALLFQLHASGAVFLIGSGLMWLQAGRGNRSWRWAAVSLLLALLPAMPWIVAHLSGEAAIQQERLPLLGAGKQSLLFNIRPLIDFLTMIDWRQWFHGEDLSALENVFRPVELLAAPSVALLALAIAWVCARSIRGKRAQLHRAIAVWALLPILLFPLVSYESYTLVYYLPLLPAPFIALAACWTRLSRHWSRIALLFIAAVCAACAFVVLGSAHFIRQAVANGDETVWAAGGGAPLSSQLKIAGAARHAVASGGADEAILLLRSVHGLRYEQMAHAMPLLSELPMRMIDLARTHLLFPARASVWLLDQRYSELPAAYTAATLRESAGPYRLYWLPGKAGAAPMTPLESAPSFANGVTLTGHDALLCDGAWRLYWTGEPVQSESSAQHIFAHLLDESHTLLAQADQLAYEPSHWRGGDQIVTTFDFGQDLSRLPVRAIRTGFYHYEPWLDPPWTPINALDEQGRPWLPAITIPLESECSL